MSASDVTMRELAIVELYEDEADALTARIAELEAVLQQIADLAEHTLMSGDARYGLGKIQAAVQAAQSARIQLGQANTGGDAATPAGRDGLARGAQHGRDRLQREPDHGRAPGAHDESGLPADRCRLARATAAGDDTAAPGSSIRAPG